MPLLKKMVKPVDLYAIGRNLPGFGGLRHALDSEAGGAWRPYELAPGRAALDGATRAGVRQVVLAVDAADEGDLDPLIDVIRHAKGLGLLVLLVAQDLGPSAMHRLLKAGADDFAPYPLPEGVLTETLARLRDRAPVSEQPAAGRRRPRGMILPVYGVAGGVGATTLAVNLAWELAEQTRKSGGRIALLDLDLQYGTVATYLDLPRREAVYELIADAATADENALAQALSSYHGRLSVLTAPADALPLDLLTSQGAGRLLELAAATHDFVVVDLPRALVGWTELVLRVAETFFVVHETDMRSAQNLLRLLRTLRAEDLPVEKLHFVLNRAPGFADLNGKTRVRRMAESLGVAIGNGLPDGGRAVANACDQGQPLALAAGGNGLRKEIRRLAATIAALAQTRAAQTP